MNDVTEIIQAAVRAAIVARPIPAHVDLTQAAEMLGVSPNTARKMERAGTIKRNKAGKFASVDLLRVINGAA